MKAKAEELLQKAWQRSKSALEHFGVADDLNRLWGALIEGEGRQAAQLAQQVLPQARPWPAVHVHYDGAMLRVQSVCQAPHKRAACTQSRNVSTGTYHFKSHCEQT